VRKGRAAAAARRSGRAGRTLWIAGAVVIIVGAALVFAVAAKGAGDTTHGTGALPASPHLVAAVTSIPPSVYSRVGLGTASPMPAKLPGPTLTKNGRPRLVYIGAEYCPYCATERWAVVAALARFGRFDGLETSHSSPLDQYPSTQTLSFHGSTYTSRYIAFEGIEQYTNIQSGDAWTKLDKTTAEQQGLLRKFDYPPYVDASSGGAIPFVDIANRYLVTGATYEPQMLQGKSLSDIASAMRDPSTDISKGAVGSANMMTAAICNVTNGQPANVCRDPAVARIETTLGEAKVAG
jgi:hypothetical protein